MGKQITPENASDYQKRSAEARKQNNENKKAFREYFNRLLDEKGGTLDGREATKKELITARAIKILLDKDTKDTDFLRAFEVIRDTIGEKPIEKMQNIGSQEEKDNFDVLIDAIKNNAKDK